MNSPEFSLDPVQDLIKKPAFRLKHFEACKVNGDWRAVHRHVYVAIFAAAAALFTAFFL